VRRHLVVSAVLGSITAIAVVLQAWLIATIVDLGFGGAGRTARVSGLILGIAICFAVRGGLSWVHQIAANRAALAVKSQLRDDVMTALLDERSVGVRPDSGSCIALLGSGIDALDGYFSKYLPQLVLMITVPVVVVTSVTWADPTSGAIVGLTLPLIIVFMILVGLLTKDKTEKRWEALKALNYHFTDVLDGLVTLKIFGRSQREGMQQVGEQHRRQSMAALKLAFMSSLVLEFFATISVALVAVSVGLRVVDGSLGLRTALFVLLLAPEAFLPLRQVGAHFHDSAEGLEAANDVFEILESGRPHTGSLPVPDLRTAMIEFEDVSYAYPDRTTTALDRLSAHVVPGACTAIIGRSGAGKSTALAVLLGFLDPQEGRVSVDGVDLRDLNLVEWRSRLAWVPQRPALIAGTIGSNVALGCLSTTDKDLREALDDAGAQRLSLEREVTEGGTNLSAGELRRVGMARALLRVRHGGSHLMVLDEPTAGLDQDTEEHVLSSLRDSGVTILLVAHRRAAINFADRIVSVGDRVVVPS
ncbi:MAG: thiol reductant ABC exporter subunit CydD, partial [Aeromicrobium sp.]